MNNNKLDIDTYMHKLVKMSQIGEPSVDFTKNVMSQILKDPSVKLSFISKDDKRSNFWLFIAVAIMAVGYSVYYYVRNGFNLDTSTNVIGEPERFKIFTDFFSNLFNELSFSPYIFVALLGVVFLVVMDKTIVKYLYSI
ncbi:MAG: hypothetical protein JEY96_09000 [Bacteroidales bacterium]|nr:hypothetical protein [Bacteroidales bacterium]